MSIKHSNVYCTFVLLLLLSGKLQNGRKIHPEAL